MSQEQPSLEYEFIQKARSRLTYDVVKTRLRQVNGILWELVKLQILLTLALLLYAVTSGAVMGSLSFVSGALPI